MIRNRLKEIFYIRRPKGLTLVLTGSVFLIIIATILVTSFIVYILNRHHVFFIIQPRLLNMLIPIAILSTVIATLLTAFISKFILAPLRKVIIATEKLADGDFDTRLNLNGPMEIKELSVSFNKMAEELGSIEILRNDFINSFSHEFKTPIVSIRGFAKLIKDDKSLTDDEVNEYLDIIISESNRLAGLATNVLNISKIENKKINTNLVEFDLTEQIRNSILLLESKWSSKGLNLDIDMDEIYFRGNEELLNQVWVNLIDNAIKFSYEEGDINISLKLWQDDVLFEIADNGIGISEDDMSKIFDKFFQANSTHKSEGTGLGLSVVKSIIDLHGGNINVVSNSGKGTLFSVVLPLKNYKKVLEN